MLAGLRSVFWWIAMGTFFFLYPIPTVNAQLRSIIQRKVPPELQGRVFSVVFFNRTAGTAPWLSDLGSAGGQDI